MYRECKSCGNELKGKVCSKCGYDYSKKEVVSPEVTEVADATRIKKKNELLFVALIGLVLVGVIFATLYNSGAIFSNNNDYKTPINEYFKGIEQADFDLYIKNMTKESAEDYKQDLKESGFEKSEYMKALYSDFTQEFGEDYKLDVNMLSASDVNKSDLSTYAGDYLELYGKELKILKGYEVATEVTVSGNKDTETINMKVYVIKVKRNWYVIDAQNF